MSEVSAIDGGNTLFDVGDKSSQMLNTEDFLKIMVTELTNQDPFEPMKNQDLLAQIASIQQLDSSETMTKTLTSVGERFDGVVDKLSQFLDREQLGSATQMVGQFVTGISPSGELAAGKVVAVNISQGEIMLELDTGELVGLNQMTRLSGNDQSLVGALVVGPTAEDGSATVGIVESVEVGQSGTRVKLSSGEEILLSEAREITADTAGLLLGRFVEGSGGGQGFVESYRINGAGIEGVTLVLDTGELELTEVTAIRSSQA
ncbi:MAG: hypothetical protein GY869_12330 [Planctomycetes bacterium]|nr:hypothetical protein [Planctomycetota bacterium]